MTEIKNSKKKINNCKEIKDLSKTDLIISSIINSFTLQQFYYAINSMIHEINFNLIYR